MGGDKPFTFNAKALSLPDDPGRVTEVSAAEMDAFYPVVSLKRGMAAVKDALGAAGDGATDA